MPVILAVDDDRGVLQLVSESLRDEDIEVVTAGSIQAALEHVARVHFDAALLDIQLPDGSGLELFDELHRRDSSLPVIFITSSAGSDTAIDAIKRGATDYLHKPLDRGQLRELVGEVLKQRHLGGVAVEAETNGAPPGAMIGRSRAMLEVYKAIGRVANEDVTVLICGESGTGKELVARAIYLHSDRRNQPFLAVNCAAIPDTLLESELFGHEKGSFTGAENRRLGKFEQCHGGTIFLDEVGDMSPLVQSKVLRLLQEQRFERVGGNTTIETDVRIIAATNRNLGQMVEEGRFRPDLYYRLNGFTVVLPPLRERGDDVLRLIEHLLARYSQELGKDVHGIAPDALSLLMNYFWPGNVRELQSVLRQSLVRTVGPVLRAEALPAEVRRPAPPPALDEQTGLEVQLDAFFNRLLANESHNMYAETLGLMERHLLRRVMQHTGANESRAAKLLGITRSSLRHKLRELGICVEQVVVEEQDEPHAAL